jgi:hypothetical protein
MISHSERRRIQCNVHSVEVLVFHDLGDRCTRRGVRGEHPGDEVLGGFIQAFLVLEENWVVAVAGAELCA